MADSQSTVALNIGSQRVTMGLLSPASNGGLILKKYDSSTILADPAAEMTRLPQIRMAIAELASKLGLSKEKVSYSISGQSVFTRFVKLPALESDNLEELVAFEAQQHVPFPIDEVIWDWQLLNNNGGEQEVVLVAIKSDALDDINDCIQESELSTKLVDASPMALANAFAYNYDDLGEPALMIDIGARTSNLIYMDGANIFTRTIAIGGGTITSAIAKEYNVPFVEAETQKCSNGMVALDAGHTTQLDESTAALASCIRTALNRMPAEIARTTNFFKSQHGGQAPTKVFLAGGGSNLPMIADFFQDKLRLPIEFFNALRKVSVGKNVDVEKVSLEAHQLGELVGLSLRSKQMAKLNIDLVPQVVQVQRKDANKRPKLLLASGLILGASAIFYGSSIVSKGKATKLADKREAEKNELSRFAIPISAGKKDATKIDAIVSQYKEHVDSRVFWLEALSDIKTHFATPELWITEFEPVVGFAPREAGARGDGYALPIERSITSDSSSSLLVKINSKPKTVRGKPNPDYVEPKVNAVRIRGFWRGDTNAIVLQQFGQLVEKSEIFGREISQDAKDNITLENNQIVINNESGPRDKDDLGAAFELIVPINNPFIFK